jgi:hypothetical protein
MKHNIWIDAHNNPACVEYLGRFVTCGSLQTAKALIIWQSFGLGHNLASLIIPGYKEYNVVNVQPSFGHDTWI